MNFDELLKLPEFDKFEVVAGNNGLYREVDNISIMEVPDIEDFLKKGDFLLTTLFPIYNVSEKLEKFIPMLNEKSVSGVGIKLNRYLEELPEYFIEQANNYDFPILILREKNCNFSDLINIFLKDSLEKKKMELEYYNTIHKQLLDIMLKGGEYIELASNLSALLNKNITLLDSNFDVLSKSSINYSQQLDLSYIKKCTEKEGYKNYISLKWKESFGYLCAVRYKTECSGYILVSDREEFELVQLDKIAIEQFSIVFRIMIQKQKTIRELENQYVTEFICDLLYGKINDIRTATSRAVAFGWKLTFPQTVCLIDTDISHTKVSNVAITQRIQQMLAHNYISNLKWNYFCANIGRYVILFLDKSSGEESEKVFKIVDAVFGELGIKDYRISVSRSADNISMIPKIYLEAERTMDISKMLNNKKVLYYKDTGIYRVLQNIENKEDLVEFCNDTLGPILEYDKNNNSNLLKTLEMILQCDCNLKDAAEKMFVHYNTIRYRSKLISNLLGYSINASAVYQDLALAIKIYHTIYGFNV